jgi:hypothetical protein
VKIWASQPRFYWPLFGKLAGVCAKTTSGQKAQHRINEKKTDSQKNGVRKMKMSRFAQRQGGPMYLPGMLLIKIHPGYGGAEH